MPTNNVNVKEVSAILGFGAIGGLLSIVYSVTVGQPIPSYGWWTTPACALLGMFAAFIGVFVIANTDTRDFLRCLGFALLCGFSWKPVYDAGAALVTQQTKVTQAKKAEDLSLKTEQAAIELKTKPAAQDLKPEELSRITSNALAAIQAAKNTDDISLRATAIDKSFVLKAELDRLKTDGKLPNNWKTQYADFTANLVLERKALSASVPGMSIE